MDDGNDDSGGDGNDDVHGDDDGDEKNGDDDDVDDDGAFADDGDGHDQRRWKDFDVRARVARMVLFDRDSSYVVHGCWFASKGGEMKSLDFNKIIEFIIVFV